jgi:hypothetical protein
LVRSRGRAGWIQAALLKKVPPPWTVLFSCGFIHAVRGGIATEDGDQVVVHDLASSRHEGIRGGVAGDTGCVGQDLLPPNETSVPAQIDHVLEEATEDRDSEALADAREAGGIGQRLVEAVAEGVTGR